MAFTDEMIRAAVRTGQYSDPAAEKHVADTLIARRDAIGRAWLTNVNPVVDPALDASGTLQLQKRGGGGGHGEASGFLRSGLVCLRQCDWYGDTHWAGGGGEGRTGERAAGSPGRRRIIRARGYKSRQSAASIVGECRAGVLPAHSRGLEASRVRAAARRSAHLSRSGTLTFLLWLFLSSFAAHGAGSVDAGQSATPEMSSSSSRRSKALSTCPEFKWSCEQLTRIW